MKFHHFAPKMNFEYLKQLLSRHNSFAMRGKEPLMVRLYSKQFLATFGTYEEKGELWRLGLTRCRHYVHVHVSQAQKCENFNYRASKQPNRTVHILTQSIEAGR